MGISSQRDCRLWHPQMVHVKVLAVDITPVSVKITNTDRTLKGFENIRKVKRQ